MNKIFKVFFIGFVSFIIISISGFYYLTRGLDSHKLIEITDLNITQLNNGIYTGSYSHNRWRNTVEVTVDKGQIVSIKPIKTVLFERNDITNELFKRVLAKQKLNVDTISGATITSKAYLKSIENALTNNPTSKK